MSAKGEPTKKQKASAEQIAKANAAVLRYLGSAQIISMIMGKPDSTVRRRIENGEFALLGVEAKFYEGYTRGGLPKFISRPDLFERPEHYNSHEYCLDVQMHAARSMGVPLDWGPEQFRDHDKYRRQAFERREATRRRSQKAACGDQSQSQTADPDPAADHAERQ